MLPTVTGAGTTVVRIEPLHLVYFLSGLFLKKSGYPWTHGDARPLMLSC